MSERKRITLLILIMACASMIVLGITIYVLYSAAIDEEQERLVETAQSQARLIEAIARFDDIYSGDYPGGATLATLSQIIDAHGHYKGFGETGEFTLARRERDNIVFLLSHRHYDLKYPKPIAFDSDLAEPMRRALSGKSGTVVGLDYRGETVLAAHEPVAVVRFGIVAKIDLAEIRAPFVRAGVLAGGFAVIIVLAGSGLFIRISKPMIRRLEEHAAELMTTNESLTQEIEDRKQAEEALIASEEKYRSLFEHANDSIFIVDPSTRGILNINENAATRLGYTREELLKLSIDDIDTPMAAKRNKAIIGELLDAGRVTFEHAHLRKDGTEIPVEISSRVTEYSGRRVFQNIVRDISQRKRTEDALSWEAGVNASMAELSGAIISSASTEDISYLVLEQAKRFTGSTFGYVGYIDPETGYLVTPTLTRDIWDSCQVPDKDIVFRKFGGLWGWVLKNRKPLLLNNPLEDSRSTGIPPGHIPIHSFLSTCAEIGEKLVGQIALANADRDYTERDLKLIERFADLYAISIQQKLAEEALHKAHHELERRVEERTAELLKSNELLKKEIIERKMTEEALQKSESELRRLSSQLLSVQEEERKRIARELHDGTGQSLSAIKFLVENTLQQIKSGTALSKAASLETAVPVIQSAIEEVRKIQTDLRPSSLDDLGILATLAWFCREYQSIYSGISIEKQIKIQEDEVPDSLKTVIYRVMQEAMNNIAKHSKAGLVRLGLMKKEEKIELFIEDNGQGFELEAALSTETTGRGFGLTSMRERTELSGGSFSIKSIPGSGTSVHVIWPSR
jgi:PAS domain S-box-containing protein